MRLFHARADRAHRAEAGADQRRAQPLRARGRPGVPRRWAGDPDRADPRHLRRRGEPGDPRRRAAGRAEARRVRSRARRWRWAGSTCRRAEQVAILERARLRHRRRARRWCRAGAATSTGPPTWSRKLRGSPAIDHIPSTPLPRADGVAKADRDARPDDRAQAAPRGRRARARRGDQLELHRRGRGRAVRRRGACRSPIRSARR